MGIFSKKSIETPYKQEVEEAKLNPSGWVYRIAGVFDANSSVPPEAIVGAWKVGSNGKIEGNFQKNPNYDSAKWPS